MSCDPRDFIKVARKVTPSGVPASQAEVRTAQGRSYYAVYLVVRDRLAALGTKIPAGQQSPHEWLSHKLKTARDEDLQDFGDRLRNFHNLRVIADYQMEKGPLAASEGFNASVRADEMLRAFGSFTDAQLRTALR